jgi:hypothetical protein
MGEEPDQVEGAGEGGACVSGDEVEIRIRESALPRTEEERAPAIRHLCAGQLVCEPSRKKLLLAAQYWRSAWLELEPHMRLHLAQA